MQASNMTPIIHFESERVTKHRAWLREQWSLLTLHCYRQKFQIYDVNQYLGYKFDCNGGPKLM